MRLQSVSDGMSVQTRVQPHLQSGLTQTPQFSGMWNRPITMLAMAALLLPLGGTNDKYQKGSMVPGVEVKEDAPQRPPEKLGPAPKIPLVGYDKLPNRPDGIGLDEAARLYKTGVLIPYNALNNPEVKTWLALARQDRLRYVQENKMDPKGNTDFESGLLAFSGDIVDIVIKKAQDKPLTPAEEKKFADFQEATKKNHEIYQAKVTGEFYGHLLQVLNEPLPKPGPEPKLKDSGWGQNTNVMICSDQDKTFKGLLLGEFAETLKTAKSVPAALTQVFGHGGYLVASKSDPTVKLLSRNDSPVAHQRPFIIRGGTEVAVDEPRLQRSLKQPDAIITLVGPPEQPKEPSDRMDDVVKALVNHHGFKPAKPGQPMKAGEMVHLKEPSTAVLLEQIKQLEPLVKANPDAHIMLVVGAHGNTVTDLLAKRDDELGRNIAKRAKQPPLPKALAAIPGSDVGLLLLKSADGDKPAEYVLETEVQEALAALEKAAGKPVNITVLMSGCSGPSWRRRVLPE